MEDWYTEWVRNHCAATGADTSAARALLSEFVRGVILDHGRTTPGELGEVTVRLLARHETPKFANEHADAVGRELVRLRAERLAATVPPVEHAPGDFAADCAACGGSGLAVIPVRACVWNGLLVLHPERKTVITGAVLCDRAECLAGERMQLAERAKMKAPREGLRPRLSQCERACGGIDLPGLLRKSEHEQAEAVRRERAKRGKDDGPLFPNMLAALARRGIKRAA